jgi:hypothetical protein
MILNSERTVVSLQTPRDLDALSAGVPGPAPAPSDGASYGQKVAGTVASQLDA